MRLRRQLALIALAAAIAIITTIAFAANATAATARAATALALAAAAVVVDNNGGAPGAVVVATAPLRTPAAAEAAHLPADKRVTSITRCTHACNRMPPGCDLLHPAATLCTPAGLRAIGCRGARRQIAPPLQYARQQCALLFGRLLRRVIEQMPPLQPQLTLLESQR